MQLCILQRIFSCFDVFRLLDDWTFGNWRQAFQGAGQWLQRQGQAGEKLWPDWRWTLSYVCPLQVHFQKQIGTTTATKWSKNLNIQDTNRWKIAKHLTDLPGAAVCNQGALELRDPVFILPGRTNKMENGNLHLVNLEKGWKNMSTSMIRGEGAGLSIWICAFHSWQHDVSLKKTGWKRIKQCLHWMLRVMADHASGLLVFLLDKVLWVFRDATSAGHEISSPCTRISSWTSWNVCNDPLAESWNPLQVSPWCFRRMIACPCNPAGKSHEIHLLGRGGVSWINLREFKDL